MATVTLVDPDPDDNAKLACSLSGSDAGLFSVDGASGLIRVGSGTVLDYEAAGSYSVTVTAADPSGASDDIAVTISVTDVNEAPTAADDIGAAAALSARTPGSAVIYTAGEREGLTTGERAELAQLRRENARLRMERDLLNRATAVWVISPPVTCNWWVACRKAEGFPTALCTPARAGPMGRRVCQRWRPAQRSGQCPTEWWGLR